MTVAIVEQQPPAKKGPSLIVQAAVLLAMTGMAVGGGWFAGGYMRGEEAAAAASAPDAAEPAAVKPGDASGGAPAEAEGTKQGPQTIVPLAPITTNLSQPADTWARIELSLVFDAAPADPGLADSVHQDLLAYIRTLKLHQIEGPSGFQHLRSDLEERAALRSDGAVKRVLIRTMLLE